MDITASQGEQAIVLVLRGRLDSSAASTFADRMKNVLDNVPSALVLDLAAVDFVSSAGLREMLVTAKRCRSQGTKLALHSLHQNVVDVFQLSGLTGFFPIHSDRTSALAAVQ